MPIDPRISRGNPRLFLDLLDIRREKNMDSTIIFVGERRSGKSYASIKLCEKLHQSVGLKFDVKTNLFFEPLGFLKRFQELNGEAIILDEASISLDPRMWYEASNRIINSVIMREGFKRNWIIFTLPNLSDLDKRAVRLCSHLVTMFGHDTVKQKSYGMVYRLKALSLAGKSFPKKIQLLPFGLPSMRNKNIYDDMKKVWNLKISNKNIEFMEMIENPETYQKPLGKDHYIRALEKGKIGEEYFKKSMNRIGIADDDVLMLIKMAEKEDIIIPKTIEELDEEEYMNEKQKVEIDILKEKLAQEKYKTYFTEIDIPNQEKKAGLNG